MEFKPQDFNTNLYNEQRIASYFYRVIQDVAAFKDKEVVNSYHHVEDFKNTDLQKARKGAIEYLTERYLRLPEGFIFPYLSRNNMQQIPTKHFLPILTVFCLLNFTMMKYLKNGRLQGRRRKIFAKD